MTEIDTDKLRALDEVIKPLVWSEPHASVSYPNWYARVAAIQFEARIDKGRALRFGEFPLTINGVDCGQKHDTLESAKDHAEARYHAVVSSLLSPAILAMAEEQQQMLRILAVFERHYQAKGCEGLEGEVSIPVTALRAAAAFLSGRRALGKDKA